MPTSGRLVVLAAEALHRCALALAGSPDETERARERLRADGAEDALAKAAALCDGEEEEIESVQRRRQAASHALDALHGRLDVQSLPARGSQ